MTSRRPTAVAALAPLFGAVACLLAAGIPVRAVAATIVVDTFAQFDAAKCTLANAINSANDDVNVAGCVRVGGIGADTIVLSTGTYALTVPDNGVDIDLTGLPVVTTDIKSRRPRCHPGQQRHRGHPERQRDRCLHAGDREPGIG